MLSTQTSMLGMQMSVLLILLAACCVCLHHQHPSAVPSAARPGKKGPLHVAWNIFIPPSNRAKLKRVCAKQYAANIIQHHAIQGQGWKQGYSVQHSTQPCKMVTVKRVLAEVCGTGSTVQ